MYESSGRNEIAGGNHGIEANSKMKNIYK